MGVFNFHEFFSSQKLLPYNYFGGSACLTVCYHEKKGTEAVFCVSVLHDEFFPYLQPTSPKTI